MNPNPDLPTGPYDLDAKENRKQRRASSAERKRERKRLAMKAKRLAPRKDDSNEGAKLDNLYE